MRKPRRKWDEIHPLDQLIRKTMQVGMAEGTLLTIEFFSGFEIFGRYENWAQGYRVKGKDVEATAEHLDDALQRWSEKVAEAKEVPA